MAKKSNAGRPTKMTPKTIGKLEEAFSWGCTDKEATFYAGIHIDTLYEYQKKNPEFVDRKNALKENPILLAKQTVVNKMTESYGNAMDYLSRKRKDEFGQKNTVDLQGELKLVKPGLIDEIIKRRTTRNSTDG